MGVLVTAAAAGASLSAGVTATQDGTSGGRNYGGGAININPGLHVNNDIVSGEWWNLHLL